jgi:predicted amidohydrolase
MLSQWAREYGMTVGAGLIESAPDGTLYNSYVVAMPDGRFARHRKLHAFIHQASVAATSSRCLTPRTVGGWAC